MEAHRGGEPGPVRGGHCSGRSRHLQQARRMSQEGRQQVRVT